MKNYNYMIRQWVDLWILGFVAFLVLASKGYTEPASWTALVTLLLCVVSMVKLNRNRS